MKDNAKEEIRGLKVKVRQLEQELSVTKVEAMSLHPESVINHDSYHSLSCMIFIFVMHHLH